MSMKTIKRIASRVLRIGENKVKISPGETARVSEALTSDDVRGLVREGVITKKRKRGVSRARGRRNEEKKKKGRGRAKGSRKGAKHAKKTRKRKWIESIRAQRGLLKELRTKGRIDESAYRTVYNRIKGGAFKNKNALYMHMKEHGWVKDAPKKEKPKKAEAPKPAGKAEEKG